MSESLLREDYCEQCGRTYTATYDDTRHVYEIGCRPCDRFVVMITEHALRDTISPVADLWIRRLARMGVPLEDLPARVDVDADDRPANWATARRRMI